MIHYFIELLLWLLAAYFIGCLIGALLRRISGKPADTAEESPVAIGDPATVMAQRAMDPEPADSEPRPGTAPMAPRYSFAPNDNDLVEEQPVTDDVAAAEEAVEPEPLLQPAAAPKARMPVGIPAPRNGKADELQRISGVGPRNEQVLHSLGFYHFDQIAQWTDEQVEWVDGYLRFNGRIRRENWIDQCRLLAEGNEEEFSRLYGTGGMADASGVTRSGERTRLS